MLKTFRLIGSGCLAWSAATMPLGACDMCKVYSSSSAGSAPIHSGLTLSVAEQFTQYSTLQQEGGRISLDSLEPGAFEPGAKERIDASITQFVIGYQFNPRFNMSVNVPYIQKSYRRVSGFDLDRLVYTMTSGVESGPGDISLAFSYIPYRYSDANFNFVWSVSAAVKLPTGDNARLADDAPDVATGAAPKGHAHYGTGIPHTTVIYDKELTLKTGIHGHQLALGSGSVDAVFGTGVFLNYRRAYFTMNGAYLAMTEGENGYQHGDELVFYGGPGFYPIKSRNYSLGVQALVSGEFVGAGKPVGSGFLQYQGNLQYDVFGAGVTDYARMNYIFAGPQLVFAWKSSLTAEVSFQLPVHTWNAGIQLMPDWRLKSGITWRF